MKAHCFNLISEFFQEVKLIERLQNVKTMLNKVRNRFKEIRGYF